MTRKLNALYRPPHAVAYAANGHTFWMVPILKGGFWVSEEDGFDDKKPPYWVALNQDYEIGQFPVTQALWRAVMGEDWTYIYFRGDERPVESVRWNDAQTFLTMLNELPEITTLNAIDNKSFKLPTEVQWEYAARGGQYTSTFDYYYSAGNYMREVAWCQANSRGKTQPVGQKRPNALGLYDMTGNVWEWCADVWNKDYLAALQYSSKESEKIKAYRCVKGGAWSEEDVYCRLSDRHGYRESYSSNDFGFRLARY